MGQSHFRDVRKGEATLVGMLVVLAIVSVIGTLVVAWSFSGSIEPTPPLLRSAKVQVQLMKSAIDVYQVTTGQVPSSLEDLLVRPGDAKVASRWSGPYLKQQESSADPWGNPYQYSAQGVKNPGSYDVWSLGPDGVDGTHDDIGNWTEQ